MSKKSVSLPNNNADSEDTTSFFSAVEGLSGQLETFERYIARRFDELSMEINATSQQVDMAEEGITKRFSEILEVLKAISFSGDGKTPANAGVELDAVVDMTEDAANRILDSASRISTKISGDVAWTDDAARANMIDAINADVEEIYMACSFQDITGQRIRKTLENLKEIEGRLNTALEKMGIVVEVNADPMAQQDYAKDQSDIDALFDNK